MEITLSRKAGLLVAETETTELFFSGDRIASDAIETIRRMHPGCDVILSGEVADEIEPTPLLDEEEDDEQERNRTDKESRYDGDDERRTQMEGWV